MRKTDLWIGLADVAPNALCDFLDRRKVKGAWVYVVAFATGQRGFVQRVKKSLTTLNLMTRSVDEVELVSALRARSGLSKELRRLVAYVKREGAVGVGTFFPYKSKT